MLDGRFVALQGFAGGALTAPAEPAQEAPDMGFVIAHPALLLDQPAHPAGGPQPVGIARRLGAALERSFELPELSGAELGLASGSASLLQTAPAGERQLPRPANHRLPMHPQLPRHFALAYALLEQLGRLHPPLFQCGEISPHACSIAHPPELA